MKILHRAAIMRLYRHLWIRYEFYAAAQMQAIIKTESASCSEQMLYGHTR